MNVKIYSTKNYDDETLTYRKTIRRNSLYFWSIDSCTV